MSPSLSLSEQHARLVPALGNRHYRFKIQQEREKKELFKIQQEREKRSYSKSSKRELGQRESDGVELRERERERERERVLVEECSSSG